MHWILRWVFVSMMTSDAVTAGCLPNRGVALGGPSRGGAWRAPELFTRNSVDGRGLDGWLVLLPNHTTSVFPSVRQGRSLA